MTALGLEAPDVPCGTVLVADDRRLVEALSVDAFGSAQLPEEQLGA